MSYKTISVIITDATADKQTLTAAAQYAQREGAHLDIHAIGVDPTRYDAMPIGASAVLLDAGVEDARAKADQLAAWAEKELTWLSNSISVAPSVVTSIGLDSSIARLTRYADMIVAAKPYGKEATQLQRLTLEAALFGTSVPVLVVSENVTDYTKPFERPLVAWNETDESLNAIRKGLPILKTALRSDIVMIDPPSHSPERSDPGGVLCLMLARHGVKSEVSILSKTLLRVSEVLNRFAREHGSDLIVMGAYGHSRFREALLGGATREMLETAELPILMAR